MTFLKKHKVFLIVFLTNSLNTFSQELVIKDFQENTLIPNVTAYNLQQTKSILSNFDGLLNLSGFKKSDTIIFSHISYEKLIIPLNEISQTVLYLYPNTQMLSEIILSVGRNREDKKKLSKKVSLINSKKTELDLPQTSADLLNYAGGGKNSKNSRRRGKSGYKRV